MEGHTAEIGCARRIAGAVPSETPSGGRGGKGEGLPQSVPGADPTLAVLFRSNVSHEPNAEKRPPHEGKGARDCETCASAAGVRKVAAWKVRYRPDETPIRHRGQMGRTPRCCTGLRRVPGTGYIRGATSLLATVPLAFAVTPAARLLALKPLLFRRLHVRHILTVLPENTAPVYLAAKPLECTVDRFVASNFNTNSQSRSPP